MQFQRMQRLRVDHVQVWAHVGLHSLAGLWGALEGQVT